MNGSSKKKRMIIKSSTSQKPQTRGMKHLFQLQLCNSGIAETWFRT